MAQFDPSIVLQATANQPTFDPIRNYMVLAQLRAAKQQEMVNNLKIQDMLQQRQQQSDVQNAYRSAAVPAQSSNYQEPGMDLGGMQIPGKSVQVSTPGGIDQNALRASILKSQPQLVPQMDAQNAQAQQTQQEQLLKMNAQQRAKAQADLEDSARRYYPILSLPPEAKAIAWKQVNQGLLKDGVIHPQQVGTELPIEYPGDQWLTAKLQSAGGLTDMLKQINEQQNAVPLSPDQAKVAGKPVGTRLPVGTVNTIDQIANRGNETPDAASLKAWLAKNPGKDASDYQVWKAKNSSSMINNQLQLSPEALQMAASLYAQTGTLPGGLSRAPQVTANVINQAAKGDSTDIAANKIAYQGKKSTTTYFTSGAGAKQLTAFNTAITHLDTLQRLAGDLNNTDVQIVNKAKQAWAEQTGNPSPANFAAAKNAMSGEVAAALKASGATDQEITHVSSTFDRAQSPAQLTGAINTYRELLKSKAQQLQGQYQSGMQGKPNFQGTPQAQPQGGGFNWGQFPEHK